MQNQSIVIQFSAKFEKTYTEGKFCQCLEMDLFYTDQESEVVFETKVSHVTEEPKANFDTFKKAFESMKADPWNKPWKLTEENYKPINYGFDFSKLTRQQALFVSQNITPEMVYFILGEAGVIKPIFSY